MESSKPSKFDKAREMLNELKGYSSLTDVRFETIAEFQGHVRFWYKANVKRESADLKKLGEALFLIREFDKLYAKKWSERGKRMLDKKISECELAKKECKNGEPNNFLESYLLALRAERQKLLKGSVQDI